VTRPAQGQQSPVFLQWLDAVHQLVHQCPAAFEFGPGLLEEFADQVYACRYGTFLGNCEADRAADETKLKTFSFWTDLQAFVERERGILRAGRLTELRLLNPFYSPTPRPLRPSANSKYLVLWPYYFRHDLSPPPPTLYSLALPRLCHALALSAAPAAHPQPTRAALAPAPAPAPGWQNALDRLDARARTLGRLAGLLARDLEGVAREREHWEAQRVVGHARRLMYPWAAPA